MTEQFTLKQLIAKLTSIQKEYKAEDIPVSLVIETGKKQIEKAVGDVAVSVLTKGTSESTPILPLRGKPTRIIILPTDFN